MPRWLENFLFAPESPVNVAVFRIVIFQMVFAGADLWEAVFWSGLPSNLRFPPPGVGAVVPFVPIGPAASTAAFWLLCVTSFSAMIGYRARLSAGLSAVLMVYVAGVMNLYGKINHSHHMVWFATILAASRCADVLSVDAYLASRRRADRGQTAAPEPHLVYGFPLRLVWILFGLIYFGPGAWKLQSAGLDWALSENPKYMLYNKWAEIGGWLPLFRIDAYPLLYKLGALGTIAFEISFIFLILNPVLRPLAVLWGVAFHMSVYFTMRIGFWTLLKCYVAFIDWSRFLPWVGRTFGRSFATVAFDPSSRTQRRWAAAYRVFDVFGLLRWDERPGSGMFSVETGGGRRSGRGAHRAVFARIPALWPAAPFTRLFWSDRSAETGEAPAADVPLESPGLRRLSVTGLLLVAAVVAATATNLNSWPIARYPTFAGLFQPEITVLTLSVQSGDGAEREFRPNAMKTRIPAARMMGLLKKLAYLEDPDERDRRLRAFWQVMAPEFSVRDVRTVRIYREKLDSVPEAKGRVIERTLLHEFSPETVTAKKS